MRKAIIQTKLSKFFLHILALEPTRPRAFCLIFVSCSVLANHTFVILGSMRVKLDFLKNLCCRPISYTVVGLLSSGGIFIQGGESNLLAWSKEGNYTVQYLQEIAITVLALRGRKHVIGRLLHRECTVLHLVPASLLRLKR